MKIFSKTLAVMLTLANLTAVSGVCAENYKAGELTTETLDFYENWKSRYIVSDKYAKDSQYYVWYSDEPYSENNKGVDVTVSEAHGYGMLILAEMAQHDDSAKEIFDGMYRYYKSHLSTIAPNLMAWQQTDNGSAIVNVSGADSATDGDMDIAYALLMADSIWGSDGEINYLQTAKDMINDIMEYEVNQKYWILQLGDWVHGSDESDVFFSTTRASDFIMQYMPVFAEVTDDDRWLNVYESTYSIINSLTEEYGTALLPDFIVRDSSGKFVPASPELLESENDGNYYYNSCRTPWRIGMDYLITGNENAKKFADTLTEFIFRKTGGDPYNIVAGYTPDGSPVEDYDDLCFTAPFLVASACGENTQWHDKLRDVIVNYVDDVYFGDTIKMLCLIVDDGGWIVPEYDKSDVKVVGDVNADGIFSIADVVAVQNYLLCKETPENIKNGDLVPDGVIDIFDLCCMKKLIVSQNG
ncbi:MAG: hypothetical protein K2J08_05820 [Ruminococcus sp.]|nr:hypothetical protein [Ruminococcus sp.]